MPLPHYWHFLACTLHDRPDLCSFHMMVSCLAVTGICLAYASSPVPKTPYIRHEDSQYCSPKCMLLPEVRTNIVWCYILLQRMSNAGHDWFHACAECAMGARPGAVEEPSPTSKTTSVFLSYKLGMSHQNKEFVHDSNHNFSFSTGSCRILVADHAGHRRESPSDTVASFFASPV